MARILLWSSAQEAGVPSMSDRPWLASQHAQMRQHSVFWRSCFIQVFRIILLHWALTHQRGRVDCTKMRERRTFQTAGGWPTFDRPYVSLFPGWAAQGLLTACYCSINLCIRLASLDFMQLPLCSICTPSASRLEELRLKKLTVKGNSSNRMLLEFVLLLL